MNTLLRVHQHAIQVSLVESGPGVAFKPRQDVGEDIAIGIALAWKSDSAIPVEQRFAEAAASSARARPGYPGATRRP